MLNDLRCDGATLSAHQLHPCLEGHNSKDSHLRNGAIFKCSCDSSQIQLRATATPIRAYLSGSAELWRPKGALLSFVVEIPRDAIQAERNGDKLHFFVGMAGHRSLACRDCGDRLVEIFPGDAHSTDGTLLMYPERSPDLSELRPEFGTALDGLSVHGCSPQEVSEVITQLESRGVYIR